MMTECIKTELVDKVLTITLNRPEKLNAYTAQMGDEIAYAFECASEDDAVSVIILTGAGRGFCAGADMSGGAQSFSKADGGPDLFGGKIERKAKKHFIDAIFSCKKPSIAAINGAAVGVGLTMTLPTDIRIAAQGAKLGFIFTRRGLVPEAGSAWFLPRIVGLPQALRWCLTGAMIGPDEALQAGLVSDVVPKAQLLEHAQKIARDIADNTSPVATAITRQMLWRFTAEPNSDALIKIDAGLNRALGQGPDVAEGVKAFFEKRAPQFPGKASSNMPEGYPWWDDDAP